MIIPAYNEEASIELVVNGLLETYPHIDYLVINDGSMDNTARVCIEKQFNLLDLPLNIGLSGAIQAGMQYASKYGYDAVLQFDGDGQHMPEYISDLCDAMIRESADIVIGSRFLTEKKVLNGRMVGSSLIELLIYLVSKRRITDPTSGMRLYNKKLVKEFAWNLNYDPEPDTLVYLIRNGINIVEVPVSMKERESGESYLNFVRAIQYMLRICLSILFIQWFRKRKVIL